MANIQVTNAWLVAFGNATAAVASTIIDQGVLLEELEDFEPSNIKVMCQTARGLVEPFSCYGWIH